MSTQLALASKLADDTMDLMDATGEDRLFMEVATVIGASSQTLEEAYLTEVRVRLAERAARKFLNNKIAKHKATQESGSEASAPDRA